MPNSSSKHLSKTPSLNHRKILSEASNQAREVYLSFRIIESPKSLLKKIEEFIEKTLSGNKSNTINFFHQLLIAYSLLQYNKEWEGLDSDNQWYLLQENKIVRLIQEIENQLIQEGYIDSIYGKRVPENNDQWGFLSEITQRVYNQIH